MYFNPIALAAFYLCSRLVFLCLSVSLSASLSLSSLSHSSSFAHHPNYLALNISPLLQLLCGPSRDEILLPLSTSSEMPPPPLTPALRTPQFLNRVSKCHLNRRPSQASTISRTTIPLSNIKFLCKAFTKPTAAENLTIEHAKTNPRSNLPLMV